jgi:hypothetical protein
VGFKFFKMTDREDQVNEIISYKPGWIIRNGNLVFLFFFILLISVSFFIHYPEVITIPARLMQDSITKTGIEKNENGNFEKSILVHKSLLGKVQAGDGVVISFENNPAGNLQQVSGTIARTLDSGGLKDSVVLYINEAENTGAEGKIISADNLVTVRITTQGQRLSVYLWKELKGFLKIKE